MSVHVDDLAPLPAGQLTPVAPVKGKVGRAIRLPRSPKVIAGLVIIAIFAILTLIGPWVAPFSPNDNSFAQNLHPSAAHWLGTSNLGADIFSQLLNGARATMVVGFIAGLVATVLSVIIGITAGYLGGGADQLRSDSVGPRRRAVGEDVADQVLHSRPGSLRFWVAFLSVWKSQSTAVATVISSVRICRAIVEGSL